MVDATVVVIGENRPLVVFAHMHPQVALLFCPVRALRASKGWFFSSALHLLVTSHRRLPTVPETLFLRVPPWGWGHRRLTFCRNVCRRTDHPRNLQTWRSPPIFEVCQMDSSRDAPWREEARFCQTPTILRGELNEFLKKKITLHINCLNIRDATGQKHFYHTLWFLRCVKQFCSPLPTLYL